MEAAEQHFRMLLSSRQYLPTFHKVSLRIFPCFWPGQLQVAKGGLIHILFRDQLPKQNSITAARKPFKFTDNMN